MSFSPSIKPLIPGNYQRIPHMDFVLFSDFFEKGSLLLHASAYLSEEQLIINNTSLFLLAIRAGVKVLISSLNFKIRMAP